MTTQQFKTLDVLRLEVKIPPTGPSNLVANPDGALGGWGYQTPVAGAAMSGDSSGLTYTSPTPSGASHFTTEPMPITAGHYAAAAWALVSITGYVRVRFEWLNSTQVGMSFTTLSGALNAPGPHAISPQQAPAGAAFVRLWFYHYGDTAFGNPAAGATIKVTGVTVATAATSGALGSSRTNLVLNPSFEVNTAEWAAYGGITLTRTTSQAASGTAALAIASAGAPLQANTGPGFITVTAGRDYTVQFKSRAATTARRPKVGVEWYDANNNGGYVQTIAATPNTNTGWTLHAATFTAPAYAVKARFVVGVDNGTAAETHYADAVMVTEGTDAPAYFDGSSANSGTVSHAWSGTAHASASTRTDTTLGSLPPPEWRNILGVTHNIKTAREPLNLGTLEAELLDADLDPATSDTLRPGGGVRLRTLVSGAWEDTFTGAIDRLIVEYDEKAVPPKPPRVYLTGLDPNRTLAGHRRTQGIAAVADLPVVLEGAGVPWNVDGNTGHVATTPAVVSVNENATALDQIALTRDTNAAHAWVNRKGVLVATTAAAGAAVRTLDEARYSDLQVRFSSEACINAVVIEALSVLDGQTVTTLYGPYEDATSIQEWGRRERRFTVHGLTPTQVAALGAAILTRNANPGVTVQSVTLPMRTETDLVDALRDLGEIVEVVNTAKGLSPDLRITTVEHRIESDPAKWLVVLGFTHAESVAAPTAAPSVQQVDPFGDTSWAPLSLINGWANLDAVTWKPAQYRRHNGKTELRGMLNGTGRTSNIFGALPVGFRTKGGTSMIRTVGYDNGINVTIAAVRVHATGELEREPAGGGSVWLSLDDLEFQAEQ